MLPPDEARLPLDAPPMQDTLEALAAAATPAAYLAARSPHEFRAHLLALTASEQRFFLDFLDLSAQVPLLAELAESPHQAMRQKAARLLRKLTPKLL